MLNNFKATAVVSYLGYITQAIMINLVPLLFATLQNEFAISLSKLTVLITITFVAQLVIDALSTKLLDKIGYRNAAVFSQFFAFIGLILLSVLPFYIDPYLGIVIAVVIGSVGTGLTEVVISPIIEAIPGEKDGKSMNLLHSFYCWGSVFVVLITVFYLKVFAGISWRFLPLALAIIPFIDGILFIFVPINQLVENKEERMGIISLLKTPVFLCIMVLMFVCGAAELAVSQWASYFAEKGLNISKSMGDLIGPCLFAVLMGTARVVSGSLAKKIGQIQLLIISSICLIASYVVIFASTNAIISLIGCALCGFFVGAMWPGTLNVSSSMLPKGGTTMFSLAALMGDLGCTVGPTMVGMISSMVSGDANGLKTGLMIATVFPIIALICLMLLKFVFVKRKVQ